MPALKHAAAPAAMPSPKCMLELVGAAPITPEPVTDKEGIKPMLYAQTRRTITAGHGTYSQPFIGLLSLLSHN